MFSIGADPEIFLTDAAGAFVASSCRIGGTKDDPLPLPIGEGFCVQEDNVALEYNIPPSYNQEEFVQTVKKAMTHLTELVQAQGLQFSRLSATDFPKEQLWHPSALMFGCEPDYNAWKNGGRNPPPRAANPLFRTVGGHVHVGHKFKNKTEICDFIKHMDLFLGVPSVVMDSGIARKELYGKAGAYRPKPFGCEYRSLSNFWIFDDQLIAWVYNNTERALKAWQEGTIPINDYGDAIIHAINTNDVGTAQILMNEFAL